MSVTDPLSTQLEEDAGLHLLAQNATTNTIGGLKHDRLVARAYQLARRN
nr:hypothetical protein [Demetria terragena]